MVNTITQVRLPKGIINEVDNLVMKGLYTSKSDVIRSALRKLILEQQIASIANRQESITQVRNARKQLSKKHLNFDEINNI
ncbi:MAG: ribbon-helix-helix domain-containing protein [Nanoarchaeota archaeon]